MAYSLEKQFTDLGESTLINAQTIASDFTTNSIIGFYNDFTVEGQSNANLSGFSSDIGAYDPNAEWIKKWDWSNPDWNSLI